MTTESNQEAPSSDDQPIMPKYSKTPFYQAVNAIRYQRQAIVKAIESLTRTKLLCYVAGDQALVDRGDTVGFVDLLHNVPANTPIDLLLHTSGGDIDAAEKLIVMIRNRVGTARLRVIVPDFAKSAGTLIALGADAIVMSDMSELGPLDPQVILSDGNGNRIRHSVQSYLDAYAAHSKALAANPNDEVAKIMLGKLDPQTVVLFQNVMNRARTIAEDQLKLGMFKDGHGNWSQAATNLLNTQRWQSHGQMISWESASDPELGLNVEYLSPDDALWERYWQLYCLQRLAVRDKEKLFESAFASLCVESTSTHQ